MKLYVRNNCHVLKANPATCYANSKSKSKLIPKANLKNVHCTLLSILPAVSKPRFCWNVIALYTRCDFGHGAQTYNEVKISLKTILKKIHFFLPFQEQFINLDLKHLSFLQRYYNKDMRQSSLCSNHLDPPSLIAIFRPLLAILLTKLRFRRSFWGAERVWTSIGSKVMT